MFHNGEPKLALLAHSDVNCWSDLLEIIDLMHLFEAITRACSEVIQLKIIEHPRIMHCGPCEY